MRGWILAAVLTSGVVFAQEGPQPLDGAMYLNPGILIGPSRMVSLGGAYTGIGETAYGFSSNLASITTRTPTENGPYSISPVFTYQLNFGEYDFDNDGVNDEADASGQWLAGLMVRYRSFGVGAFVRTNSLEFCVDGAKCEGLITDPNRIRLALQEYTFAAGYNFFDESLAVALGLIIGGATIENNLQFWGYRGATPQVGILVRPRGMFFRVGISARPLALTGGYLKADQPKTVVGRQIYSGIVSPASYSFGVSFRVGEGAFTYNDLPSIDAKPPNRALDARNPFSDIVRNRDDLKNGRLLLTMQLDIYTAVENAVSVGSFIRVQDPVSIGSRLMYTPRIGAEHMTIIGRLKTRAGGYLEASPYPDRAGRLHVTGGAELFLFRLIDDWALTLMFDIADKYNNIGLSFGTWR